MSLPEFTTQSALFSISSRTDQLFGATDRYRLFASKIYPLLVSARAQLENLYCLDNGRPAVEPVLLLGVSLLQYLEGMPDRQAVEQLRYHAGWNFALNRSLGEESFHPTCLVNFRQRLIENEQSALIFRQVLEGLLAAGLVARQSKQRLDATQVFGLVRWMSWLDCVREALRLALKELTQSAAGFGPPAFWAELMERYVESKVDYKASSPTLERKLQEAGVDAARLLHWVKSLSDATIGTGQQVALLQRVFDEHFELVGEEQTVQRRTTLSSDRVQNPHDPDARYAVKGQGKQKKEHVGYKVQVAETVAEGKLAPGEPTRNFVCGILTHAAQESDEAGAEKMQAEQAAMGLEKPPALYVDGAYVSAQTLAEAAAEGRRLVGPAAHSPLNNQGRFTAEQFQIDVEARQALCPAGQPNTQCSRLEEQHGGKVSFRFEWSTHCQGCPLREQCVAPGQKHRTVVVGEFHSALQARRAEQQTEAFVEEIKQRNAIEGTQSELVRAHGLRRARYRGLAKVRLQNYFAGAACNTKRWIRRTIWQMKQALPEARPAVDSA
jgi:transposase